MDLQDTRELNAYQLSAYGEGAEPDALDSIGADFLIGVRDALLEALEYQHTDGDRWADTIAAVRDGDALHELADGAPSVYTHTRWLQFVDLGAWQVDIDDLGGDSGDMTATAGLALYELARQVATGILDDLDEWAVDIDAESEADDED